ncbi:hypothetical protein CYMTET_27555 [Cymbomonas tetramitiformis]|uniref:Uncharacterized protein n=1 Tax=Cymbomonas tetramitiformis TaxID=36881 RepID=A0AAE0FPM5_9CHLO|nr:hypothetical protein CYMTET_27555 [Cymbomonas tetramitiformis]
MSVTYILFAPPEKRKYQERSDSENDVEILYDTTDDTRLPPIAAVSGQRGTSAAAQVHENAKDDPDFHPVNSEASSENGDAEDREQADNGMLAEGHTISAEHANVAGRVGKLGVRDDDDDPDYVPEDSETLSETEDAGRWKEDEYGTLAEKHTTPEIKVFEDPSEAAEHLYENGYVLLNFMDEEEISAALEEFQRTLCEDLPEFKPKNCKRNEKWEYGCTGFGAVNTASSFHNRFVRAIRLRAHVVVAKVLDDYRKKNKHPKAEAVRLQQLFGRMSVRVRSPTPELWHQDNAETSQYGDGDYREANISEPLPDVTFGGWIAFNQGKDPVTGESVPQGASLYSNSHGYVVPAKARRQGKNMGFGKLTYEDVTSLIEDRGGRSAGNPTLKTLVRTPPGTIFLMHQTIVHEVRAVKPPEPMFRLYLQFRLTSDDRDLLEFGNKEISPDTVSHAQDGDHRAQNVDDVCENMRVPKLPSNQMPSMYNRKGVDMNAQKPNLLRWFNLYVREEMRVVENVYVNTGLAKPLPSNMDEDSMDQDGPEKKYYVMPLHAPSLSEIRYNPKYSGMQRLDIQWDDLFPVYDEVERNILKPSVDNFGLQPTVIRRLIENLSNKRRI